MADFTDDTLGEKVGQSPAAHSVILGAVRPTLKKVLERKLSSPPPHLFGKLLASYTQLYFSLPKLKPNTVVFLTHRVVF